MKRITINGRTFEVDADATGFPKADMRPISNAKIDSVQRFTIRDGKLNDSGFLVKSASNPDDNRIDRELSDFDEFDWHAPTKPLKWWQIVCVVVLAIGAAWYISQ